MKVRTHIEQNLFDVAIQHYGTADAAWDIIQKNHFTLGFDTPLFPDSVVEVEPKNNKITLYFSNKTIATGEIYLTGIGYSIIDDLFAPFIVF